jgi:hypothetical protein
MPNALWMPNQAIVPKATKKPRQIKIKPAVYKPGDSAMSIIQKESQSGGLKRYGKQKKAAITSSCRMDENHLNRPQEVYSLRMNIRNTKKAKDKKRVEKTK